MSVSSAYSDAGSIDCGDAQVLAKLKLAKPVKSVPPKDLREAFARASELPANMPNGNLLDHALRCVGLVNRFRNLELPETIAVAPNINSQLSFDEEYWTRILQHTLSLQTTTLRFACEPPDLDGQPLLDTINRHIWWLVHNTYKVNEGIYYRLMDFAEGSRTSVIGKILREICECLFPIVPSSAFQP